MHTAKTPTQRAIVVRAVLLSWALYAHNLTTQANTAAAHTANDTQMPLPRW